MPIAVLSEYTEKEYEPFDPYSRFYPAMPISVCFSDTALCTLGKGLGSFMLDSFRNAFPVKELTAETDDEAVEFYRKYGFAIQPLGDIYHSGIKRYLCRICKDIPEISA